VVAGADAAGASAEQDPEAARALARALLAEGSSPSSVAKEVAKRLNMPRNLAYEVVQEAKEG
jgi:hypothetical protein